MKYTEFETIVASADIPKKFWPVLWRSFRFEKPDYMPEALDEFFAKVPRISTVKDILQNETVKFGAILKKFRMLRPVTRGLLEQRILDTRKVLENCDIYHDSELEAVYFPLVYPRCSCGRTMRVMQSDGIWRCVCGMTAIDEFFIADAVRARGGGTAAEGARLTGTGARDGKVRRLSELFDAPEGAPAPEELPF